MIEKQLTIKHFLLILLTFWGCTTTSAWAEKKIFVSPKGNDRAEGTLTHPLRSIQAALEKAEAFENEEVRIILRQGSYEQSKTLEIGSQGKYTSLTICPYQDENVSISGGRVIPLSAIKRISDKKISGRLPENVRKRVREIDFKRLNIPIADLRPSGFGRPSSPAWSELFANDIPLNLSRWPNDSTVLIGKVLEAGTGENVQDAPLPVFQYFEERPSAWSQAGSFWIGGYFAHGYASDMIRVGHLDSKTKTIYTAQQTVYGFMTGADWRRWYALNLLEELDLPGEYVIDKENEKMYVYLPADTRTLHVSVMNDPLTPDKQTLKPHAAEAGGDPKSRVVGDLMGRVYQDILFNRNGGTDNGIINCYIYNTGSGGISLGGGDRATLTPAGNFVENCRIHDFNRVEKSYRPGIWIDGVGNRVSKCDIYNAPSMAILFHGNNHTIEFCKITNVCSEVDDQGAIYYGRDPSELGNVIRYCYFHKLSPRHRVTATYHDDEACGGEVYGNIYHNAGSLPVLIGGGHYNHYHHNIFIDSPVAIHFDNRMQNWGKGMVAPNGIIDQRLKAVKFQEPPYTVPGSLLDRKSCLPSWQRHRRKFVLSYQKHRKRTTPMGRILEQLVYKQRSWIHRP